MAETILKSILQELTENEKRVSQDEMEKFADAILKADRIFVGFWDFSTYFIPRHASFSIEFIDSGTDDFNGCHLDFVSSVSYRITHK